MPLLIRRSYAAILALLLAGCDGDAPAAPTPQARPAAAREPVQGLDRCAPNLGRPPPIVQDIARYQATLAKRRETGDMTLPEFKDALSRLEAAEQLLANREFAAACTMVATVEADYALSQ